MKSYLLFCGSRTRRFIHFSAHLPEFTSSASSLPVISLFSITGLMKNIRRLSIVLYRLEKLTFIYENYGKFSLLHK
jgi:hypothetical protein